MGAERAASGCDSRHSPALRSDAFRLGTACSRGDSPPSRYCSLEGRPSDRRGRTPRQRRETAAGGRGPRPGAEADRAGAGHVGGGAGRGLAELLHCGRPGRGHRDHCQRIQRPVHPVSGAWEGAGGGPGREKKPGGGCGAGGPQAGGVAPERRANGGRRGGRCASPWGQGRAAWPGAALTHKLERGCLWGHEKSAC